MLRRTALIGLIVICITILGFTWMVRDSLCELQIKNGDSVFLAHLAYEPK
ncbi:protein pndA [Photobacterium frigidiphilum]|uniref:Protein pndA n=1 Tax=Photobacterium frigidiphilum TaxID=264736 RepID=A0A2T3J713_9GAMM|nr:Hok/Gef family protein [Photobacterium frigidiphilum]PSU44275.1 protein pndA [Photobacterium frigidiphilum]